jgi:uncharacterized membrane protein YhhN
MVVVGPSSTFTLIDLALVVSAMGNLISSTPWVKDAFTFSP